MLRQGNSIFEKTKDDIYNNSLNDDEMKEKKLLGDLGYDCN